MLPNKFKNKINQVIEILIVDDNGVNNMVLKALIEQCLDTHYQIEYHIWVYEESQKALEHIQNNKIDIVFLDIVMPHINGFDFLNIVRNNSSIEQPIIIMATALGNKKFREKKKSLGANAFIIKPFTSKQIEVMFGNYLKKLLRFDRSEMSVCTNIFNTQITSDNIFLHEIHDKLTQYEKISSQALLQENNQDIDIQGILEDIDISIFQLFNCDNSEGIEQVQIDIRENKEQLEVIFHDYKILFEQYDELQDYVHLMLHLTTLLNSDIATHKVLAASLVKYIIKELIVYKERVFIEQNTLDIYYNIPILLDATLQLENISMQIDTQEETI